MGATSRQPPAAGLISRQQDTYFIPPPSRAVGGARGRSVPVSTATLGLIHRQDPALAALLREEPGTMMSQRTRLRVYSTMCLIRTGLIGQMASLQQCVFWKRHIIQCVCKVTGIHRYYVIVNTHAARTN